MKIFAFADEASSMIDNQIIALKENGLDGLEIRNVDGVSVSDISDYKAKEVKAKMDSAEFKVWSIGSPIGKINIAKDDLATHTEKFKRTLEIADILGAENIRLFSFYMPKDTDPENYFDAIVEQLGKYSEIAKGSGVTLCHENEKFIYGDIPERCLKLHKALPDIKAIFDPANFVQCGVDTLKAWEILSPYVKYMHIKDAFESGDVVPAGKGVGNVAELLKKYIAMGGSEVTLEPHLAVFEGLAALENAEDRSVVGEIYKYSSNEEAFKVAAKELKGLLYN